MKISIPQEQLAGETRVAATPTTVEQRLKLGLTVFVSCGAGAVAKVLLMIPGRPQVILTRHLQTAFVS